MNGRTWLRLFAILLGLVVPAALQAEPRFSDSMSATERTETGIARLSSDEVGAIDALVRRDQAHATFPAKGDVPRPVRFSHRLYDEERRAAGFARLTEAELARLDQLVERFAAASSARALSAPLVLAPPRERVPVVAEKKPAREIHGSFSLSMGWGKGGYSERTGAMTLNYEDPERHLAVSIGYAESRIKGPATYLYREPAAVTPPAGP